MSSPFFQGKNLPKELINFISGDRTLIVSHFILHRPTLCPSDAAAHFLCLIRSSWVREFSFHMAADSNMTVVLTSPAIVSADGAIFSAGESA